MGMQQPELQQGASHLAPSSSHLTDTGEGSEGWAAGVHGAGEQQVAGGVEVDAGLHGAQNRGKETPSKLQRQQRQGQQLPPPPQQQQQQEQEREGEKEGEKEEEVDVRLVVSDGGMALLSALIPGCEWLSGSGVRLWGCGCVGEGECVYVCVWGGACVCLCVCGGCARVRGLVGGCVSVSPLGGPHNRLLPGPVKCPQPKRHAAV